MASLEIPTDDPHAELRLRCCTGRWRSLGEVRAAQGYGADSLRSNIELAVWTRRLAYEAGLVGPVSVELPPLKSDSPAHVGRARAGFALLLGLRWLDHERRPVAFSVRFCSAWCDLPHRAAHEAVQGLRRQNVIREVARAGHSPLYLPAEVEPW